MVPPWPRLPFVISCSQRTIGWTTWRPTVARASIWLGRRSFEDVTDAEFACDLLHIDSLTLVGESRVTGDDEEPADAGERGNDLLDHPICEILLLWVASTACREGAERVKRRLALWLAGPLPRRGGLGKPLRGD